MTAVLDPDTTTSPAFEGDRFDPFRAPTRRAAIGDAPPRTMAVIEGDVVHVTCRSWVGGPTVEVTVIDDTGSLVLAFTGRRSIGGIEPGRRLVAAGRVVEHHRGRLILNPYVWLAT